uniref:FAD/NAD(P)-binding domain-containing protein n=1 Tax=Kalanchoe fedtschenkoi TaxID=63787 RepID=A0A7N0U7S6_KALFE
MDSSTSAKPITGGKSLVIIGGGVAGSLLASSLQFIGDVTLVDPKEYFEIPWASLRSTVEPSFAARSVIRHADYLTNGRVVVSRAVAITEHRVLTADDRAIPYDYLVIATGHDDRTPSRRIDRLKQFESDHQRIKAAKSILVVGGGPSGVELAGEIAVDFPEKQLTLVHEGPRLLEFIGPKAAGKALEWLKSRRVEVCLGRSFDSDNGPGEADCTFLCTGRPVASGWLKATSLKSSLDGNGRLMVDEHLRVKGYKNTFAVGDITDIREMKQGYLAQRQALVAAANLKLLMSGGKESKMDVYKSKSIKTIVSLGRKDAVAQYSFTTVIGLVPGLIKSKDLYVGKTRKLLGLEPHFAYE